MESKDRIWQWGRGWLIVRYKRLLMTNGITFFLNLQYHDQWTIATCAWAIGGLLFNIAYLMRFNRGSSVHLSNLAHRPFIFPLVRSHHWRWSRATLLLAKRTFLALALFSRWCHHGPTLVIIVPCWSNPCQSYFIE